MEVGVPRTGSISISMLENLQTMEGLKGLEWDGMGWKDEQDDRQECSVQFLCFLFDGEVLW